MKISKVLVFADRVADYTPVVCAVSNLVVMFEKTMLFLFAIQGKKIDNYYFNHIRSKNNVRCFYLIINPVFGFMDVFFYDVDQQEAKNSNYEYKQKYYQNFEYSKEKEKQDQRNNDTKSEPIQTPKIDPYQILKINEIDITKDKLKKAFRELARKNHPDQVSKRGGTQQELENASEIFKKINNAYDEVLKEKGWER